MRRLGLAEVRHRDKSIWVLTRDDASLPLDRARNGMQKITAYILSYNEAEKIEAAVSSVLWADEVLVVDSFSVDRTTEIATALGARVVNVEFKGFGDLRNRALQHCAHEWIFSLDSDERCTAAVRDEILHLLSSQPPHDVYNVPRRSYMMGRWIRGSGWYPNFRQPQLFRNGALRYTLEPVHEGYQNLSGKPIGTLKNAIWQFPFRDFDELIRKMNRYSSLGVPKLAGKSSSLGNAFGHGLWSFVKHYVFKLGFIDGWAGFLIAFGNFEGTFYRYAKKHEQDRHWASPKSEALRRPDR
jgi:glycosyltransferase involved in cell wall biosynthesis